MDGSHSFLRRAVTGKAHSGRPVWYRPRLAAFLFGVLGASLLLATATVPASAAPTVTLGNVRVIYHFAGGWSEQLPLRQWPGYASARYDGTHSSIFRYWLTVRASATTSSITTVTITDVGDGGYSENITTNYPRFTGQGFGAVPIDIVGWRLANHTNPVINTHNVFWNRNTHRTRLRVDAWEVDANGAATETIADFPDVVVGPSGREVLIPVDDKGQPDFYRGTDRTSPNTGGLTVTAADIANDDDGTSSSTYTFRVKYQHPDGLPPRIPSSALGYPPTADAWRFPAYPDATLPASVRPPSYSYGVGLYLDTDALADSDGGVLTCYVNDGFGGRPNHKIATFSRTPPSTPLVHFMTIDTELQPQYAGRSPESLGAEDWKAGVIFRYVILPTNHEVAAGLPNNLFNGQAFGPNAISTDLVSTFGQVFGFQGLRYVDGDYRFRQSNNRRQKGPVPGGYAPGGRDTTQPSAVDAWTGREQYTAPFLALSAGQHGFTYRTTSDFTSPYWGGAGGTSRDSFGYLFQEIHRYPDYNAPAIHDIIVQPSLVFPEASADPDWMQFHKPLVNPALDTDVATAIGSPPDYEMRIATPVTVPAPLRIGVPSYGDPSVLIGGAGGTSPEVLLIDATRVLSAEKMRFKVYYTQSLGVAPIVAQVLVYQRGVDGSYPAIPTHVKGMLEDASAGSYRAGRAYYYDIQLPPGEYRYYYRFNDGTRTVEWPGDSQAKIPTWAPDGTSLTNGLNVSRLANTLRVNAPVQLGSPQTTPAFGAEGTPYTYEVDYNDPNGDGPRYSFLLIGTHTDSVAGLDTAGLPAGQRRITLADPINPATLLQPDTYIGGEISVIGRGGSTVPDALRSKTFRITDNSDTTFTVEDQGGLLNAGDRIEIRRRVQMVQWGSGAYDAGVKFKFDTATDNTIKLEDGTRTYHFEFTDNWGTEGDPETGETTRFPNGVNNEIQGPIVELNDPPVLLSGRVVQPNDNVPLITGTSATPFTFSVRYADEDNNPATQMQLSIDPTLQDVLGATYDSLTFNATNNWNEVTISGVTLVDHAHAGMLMRISDGPAQGRRYEILDNVGTTLILPSWGNPAADGAVPGNGFVIQTVDDAGFNAGDVKAMSPANPADVIYADGADFQVITRLAVGPHYFAFRASDGVLSVMGDSLTRPKLYAGPQVDPNQKPTLSVGTYITDDGANASIQSVGASTITVTGRVLARNEWQGGFVEVLQGAGPATRGMVEIANHAASDSGNGQTVLNLIGNPPAGTAAGDRFAIRFRVAPPVGKQGTTFRWRVSYGDLDNDSPEGDPPAYVRLVIDNNPSWSDTNVTRTRVDPTDQNYRDGVEYEFSTNTLSSGAHSYYFEANDGADAVRAPGTGVYPGPAVNDAPVLEASSLAPIAGTPTAMYRFEVTYKDPDNDPPDVDTDGIAPNTSYPRLVIIRDATGTAVTDATNSNVPYFYMQPVATGSYITGVRYRYDLQLGAPGLGSGKHTYRFEVSSTGGGRTQGAKLGPFDGPHTNTAPGLSEPKVLKGAVENPTGSRADEYVYQVTYRDSADGDAPATVTLTVRNPDATVVGTYPMAPAAGAVTTVDGYKAGVIYEYKLPARTLAKDGAHSFAIDAADSVVGPRISYSAVQVTGGGPTIVDVPVLSGQAVQPAAGIVGQSFQYTVLYKHEGRKAPASVKLFIYNDAGAPLDAAGYPMTTTQTDTNMLPTSGWTYQRLVPLNTAGDYTFTVQAVEGATTVTVPAAPGREAGPDVMPPSLTAPTVSPLTGGHVGGDFVFAVTYTDGRNIAPGFVRLNLTNPDGSAAPAVDLLPISAGAYSTGKVFQKSVVLRTEGTYRFFFEASENGTAVSATSATVTGPVIGPVQAGTLTEAKVAAAAAGGGRYTYSVIFKQPQGLAAAWVRLDLDVNAGQASKVVEMAPASAGAADYAVGVLYSYTTPTAVAPGNHNFRVRASDGTTQLETAIIAGPSVNTPPALVAEKVVPARGDENTEFLFRATYTDADNQAPQYVRVYVGNLPIDLQPVNASDTTYTDGVLYEAKAKLPAGDLAHSFAASDGTTVARTPATGTTAGPKVYAKTGVTLALSRSRLVLDGMTAVSVNGTTNPPAPAGKVTVTFSLVVPQAGGSSAAEVRHTEALDANADGKFTAAFLPDQDGDWIVKAEYAGDVAQGGSRGSGVGTLPFQVDPAELPLGTSLYMVGLPIEPAGRALSSIFTGAAFQTAVYTGAQATPYVYGPDAPFPTVRPGMGFWLKSAGPLRAVASGRTADHTKEFVIPVRVGWQQIANPYLVPVDWSAVRFATGTERVTLAEARARKIAYDHGWVYDGGRNEMRLVHATAEGADREIQAWQGVWFLSRVAGQLVFAAPTGRSAATVADARADRARHRGDSSAWSIRLTATNGVQSDSFNYAGVGAQGRAAGNGALLSPPVLPGYVDLYFTDPGEGDRYATDYRSASAGEQSWSVVVETDIPGKPVTVRAPNLSQVPKTLDVLLEDLDAGGKRVYLRTAGGYTVNLGEGGKRRLRLIVRPRANRALLLSDVAIGRSRGGSAISYNVSRDAVVTVEVLSPTGRRLKLVADRVAAAQGRATAFWDETRDDGARLPAGLYLVQVTAVTTEGQSARDTKPVAIVR